MLFFFVFLEKKSSAHLQTGKENNIKQTHTLNSFLSFRDYNYGMSVLLDIR